MGARRTFSAVLLIGARILCCSAQAQSFNPAAGQLGTNDAQQLLKARDEARPKAKAAEKRLREGGKPYDFEGFEKARAARDQHLRAAKSAGARVAAHAGYAKAAKSLEGQIEDEVKRGLQPPDFLVIAHFERLQAEVELAQAEGRLPASPAKGK